jgi:hypothetical protein
MLVVERPEFVKWLVSGFREFGGAVVGCGGKLWQLSVRVNLLHSADLLERGCLSSALCGSIPSILGQV